MDFGQVITDLAKYGYRIDDGNQILAPGGKPTGVRVRKTKQGRLQVRSDSGNLLWSGPRIGNFLESFWFAEPTVD